jgi:O-antigen/teichoic acid export membrane protein
VAVLAGFGMDDLLRGERRTLLARRIGCALAGVGALTLVGLLLSRLFYQQIEPLIDRVFHGLAKAPEAFADARMFYSYQFTNVLIFGVMALGAGAVFWLASRNPSPPTPLRGLRLLSRVRDPLRPQGEKGENTSPDSPRPEGEGQGVRAFIFIAFLLIPLDLMIASWGFNPASDPALLDFTPPAVQWLMQQPGDWRYTTLDDPNQPSLLKANAGMRYGLDDIRGYESIIPKQYVDYMEMIAPQVQRDFNRVAPLYTPDDYNHFGGYHQALDSPLFDLLNVRYVIAHRDTFVYFQEWKLVYEDAGVRIWENDSLVPRAYTVASAGFDRDAINVPEEYVAAAIESDSGREQMITASVDAPSWLVVSQSYFPGWRAFIRPYGAGEDAEQPAPVELVQGNFQGVQLPVPTIAQHAAALTNAYFVQALGSDTIFLEPLWTIRLVYSQQGFQIGAFASFMSAIVVLFLAGVWLWRLYVTPAGETASAASRVAKNSFAPIVLNLFNRGIDFAFAFVMLRVLGPEGSGIYYYAVIIFGWFDIFTNFGLNLFLTREVARDKSHARRYLVNTSALRLVLALIGVPMLLAFLSLRQSNVSPLLTAEALLAIGLLYIGLVPNSLSTGLSALFYAFERAEVPAAIATVATICKTVFGLAALLAGYGVVGLAGVSILTNLVTLVVMIYSGRDMFVSSPHPEGEGQGVRVSQSFAQEVEPKLMRRMAGESWPLMLNHFLASIFFQIDIVLIEAMHGNRMVGQYSVAYKWVLALNVIPSFFTQALLPVMSRQANEDKAALKRNYGLAIQLLVSTALPVAVLFTFMAESLTRILGGAEYLPDGAIALQLMIWSIPIGWMNSLTQYVLIALDLQRRITWAFIIGVGFNLITNFIFIPQYGYRAAALTTIASEAVLFIPFALLLRRDMGSINWLSLLWRPLLATAAMLGVLLVGWPIMPALALVASCAVYAGVLIALNPAGARQGWERVRVRFATRT